MSPTRAINAEVAVAVAIAVAVIALTVAAILFWTWIFTVVGAMTLLGLCGVAVYVVVLVSDLSRGTIWK